MSFHNNDRIIAEGEHLAVIRSCADCHGENLGGKAVIDDPMIGSIYASNLTSGEGGVGSIYSDEALAQAIRHGVRPDGTGLLVMPSSEYYILSNEDVNALVAYIRSVPAVDQTVPPINLTMMARALFMAGQLPPLAAEIIDHQAERLMNFFSNLELSPDARAFPELTEREHEVLEFIARGLNNQDIASNQMITHKTVRNHVSNIFNKLQVVDRSQAIIRACEAGMGH